MADRKLAPVSWRSVERFGSGCAGSELMSETAEDAWRAKAFEPPEIFVESPWAGLIPVMNILIPLLRPRVFAELGTYRGCSFLAALSAAKASGVEMQCFAIDTWSGDPHGGFYDGETYFREVEAGAREIGGDAQLLRMDFDQARGRFEDGSIDLLHIDGYHTFEASKHDFVSWRDKLSERGVVMFHDIAVHDSDFGVWRTWSEIEGKFPTLRFDHSCGLGVAFVGPEQSPEVAEFLSRWQTDPTFAAHIRQVTQTAGAELRAVNAQRPQQSGARGSGTGALGDALRREVITAREALRRAKRSKLWFLVRCLSPITRRVRRIEESLARMETLLDKPAVPSETEAASAIAPRRREVVAALDSLPPKNQDDMVNLAPLIASWIRAHGMRPGQWVAPALQRVFQREGFSLVSNTFYSVCPDIDQLRDEVWRPGKFSHAWTQVAQRDRTPLIDRLQDAARAMKHLPVSRPRQKGVYFWSNEMFAPIDALAYRAVIDEWKPRRILEVGSGFSTSVALDAAEALGQAAEVSCIEPYPSGFLLALEKRLGRLVRSKVEDVDPTTFTTLAANDILFIDSSHCVRIGSDLNFLVFEVLPRLQPGVLIHFHDIFLPSEYPKTWLRDVGIMWNEQYLLLALLMNSGTYEVLWSSSEVCATMGDELSAGLAEVLSGDNPVAKGLGPYSGGSIWIRKRDHAGPGAEAPPHPEGVPA